MIYRVPQNKKIYYNISENIFTNNKSIWTDRPKSIETIISRHQIELMNELILEDVKSVLYQLDIYNYELTSTYNGWAVDVHNHLYLPNKKLNKLNFLNFYFNVVDGNVIMTGNDLTDWKHFPIHIKGNCYANYNKIKSFKGVPQIDGILVANKQKTKTEYPLTQENYINYMKSINMIHENDVYLINYNSFGKLQAINEKNNTCVVKCDDNVNRTFKLDEVNYCENIDELFI